jgi:hypothetical protein
MDVWKYCGSESRGMRAIGVLSFFVRGMDIVKVCGSESMGMRAIGDVKLC